MLGKTKLKKKTTKPVAVQMNTLKILNVEKGVSFLNGDYSLYTQVLRRFVDKDVCEKSLKELFSVITNSDWRSSLVKLKALKSSASLLLAERLHEKVNRLETTILNEKRDYDQVKILMYEMLIELKETIISAAEMLHQELPLKFLEDAVNNLRSDLSRYISLDGNRLGSCCTNNPSCSTNACNIF